MILVVQMNFKNLQNDQIIFKILYSALRRANTADMPTTPALVTDFSIRTVLQDMANLVTIVAGVFFLVAIPCDVSRSMAFVTALLFLITFTGEMTKPVALVAFG